MWVGGVADSQTRSKPLRTSPNYPENRIFRPEFHLSFSQISQKPWGGWVGKHIWERYPKKNVFFISSLISLVGCIFCMVNLWYDESMLRCIFGGMHLWCNTSLVSCINDAMHLWCADCCWIFGALHFCCAASLVRCKFGELYIYCNISLMNYIFGVLHHWCYV